MSLVLTCSDLCSSFADCYTTLHPEFTGSKNALVPCENTCYGLSEAARDDLRLCAAKDCVVFAACGTGAGLKLQPQPPPPDMSVAADMTAPRDMAVPRDMTPLVDGSLTD